jgi:uncharacterized protein
VNNAEFGPIGLLVIQATSLCNLDCSYCYLPDRQKRKIFDLELLPTLLERIYESPFWGPQLSILWHAGEPLTLPTGYYDEATAILRRHTADLQAQGVVIEQHVQTNATLINADWCDCFRRNQIVVGVSVDGPEDIHDAHRRFRNQRGSHALTMKGIKTLQAHEVPFHAIAVITSAAMEDPERVYRFFRDQGIHHIGFNVEEQEGVHTQSSMQGQSREKQYRSFLSHFWDCNRRDGFPIHLREFDQVLGMIQGEQRLLQNEMNRPYAILSVDAQGNFSTFDPELLSVETERYGLFNLGNIREVSLEAAASSSTFQRLLADMRSGMSRCLKTCDYYGFCGGGNGSNKYWEHGTLDASETCSCRFSSQIPVDVVLERLELESATSP